MSYSNFTVKTTAVFLSLFTYQTFISHSVSSCLSCSAGIIVGAVFSVVASHLIQILNGSYSTVSYVNALKPKYPGQTHLTEKLRAEPPFPIYKDILCIWRKKKSVLKENCRTLLLLINNCLGKEHPSMVKNDSPRVISSVMLFPLRWLSTDFSYKAMLAAPFIVQSSLLI